MASTRTQQKRSRSNGGRPRSTSNARNTRNSRNTRTSNRARSGGRSRSGQASQSSRSRTQTQSPFTPNEEAIEELVLQALETELGGVQVYTTALKCAQNEDLQEEWQKYLEQTERHVEVVQKLCQDLGIDLDKETPGRQIVRLHGETHVKAMKMALQAGDLEKAEVCAAEMVVLAEVKDHSNWELIGALADELGDDERATFFQGAYDEVEDEEDEHLYHTMGWARELWIQGLGMPAALPPPEEEKDAKSMAEAAKAKSQRKRMVKATSR